MLYNFSYKGLSGQIEDKMSPPPPPPRLLKERESTVTENVSPPSRPKKAPKAPQIRYAPTARRRVPSKATYPSEFFSVDQNRIGPIF